MPENEHRGLVASCARSIRAVNDSLGHSPEERPKNRKALISILFFSIQPGCELAEPST